MTNMTFHLSAAGTPISWSLVAVYGSSYGIAHNAAESWYARSIKDTGDGAQDTPQFICELNANGVVRQHLWFGAHHLRHQSPDDSNWLVQTHTFPLSIPVEIKQILVQTLRTTLIEKGYLVPRVQWEQRYPAQHLISQRFAEFSAAHRAHRESDADADGDMPFDPRWTMMMERPDDYRPTTEFDIEPAAHGQAYVVAITATTRQRLGDLCDRETARNHARLLNSGWSTEEVEILMREEPINL